MDAVKAVSQVDHEQSVAQRTDLQIGADSRALQESASYAYLKDAFDEDRLDEIELPDDVTDEDIAEIKEAMETLPESLQDSALPDGFTVEDIEEAADACDFTDEQLRTIVELETKIDSIAASKEAEMKLIKDGDVGHAAVAVVLVVAVVYVAVSNR
mgnify:CR=1 FL=1